MATKTHTQTPGGATPFKKPDEPVSAPVGDQAAEKEVKQGTGHEIPAEDIDFSANAGEGLTGHKMSDYKVPFLTIVQDLSPQRKETDAKYDPDAKCGMIVNTVSGDIIEVRASLDKYIEVVPVSRETEYIEWAPKRGGLVAVHKNESILGQTKKGTGDDATKDFLPNGNIIDTTSKWFVMLKQGDNEYIPVIIAMSRSNLKHSRAWLTKISNERMKRADGSVYQPAMYSRHWKLSTVPEVKNGNTYFAWNTEPGELVKKKDTYLELQGLRAAVVGGQLALPDAEQTAAALGDSQPGNF